MGKLTKNNYFMLMAFLLPIVLIAIVAIIAYIPSMFMKPQYDFIYATCDNGNEYMYGCNTYMQRRFSVINGKIAINNIDSGADLNNDGKPDPSGSYSAHIFMHDVKKNESREISESDAQKFMLSGLLTSPDGMTISDQYGHGADFFPFFGSGSSYDFFITKGSSRKKLNLIGKNNGYYYRDNFKFIGWITK